MKQMLALAAVCWGLTNGVSAEAAKPIVELTVDGQTYAGRAVAHDKRTCWLLENNGRLHQLDLNDVTKFRKLPGQFTGLKAVDLRNQLQKEMGHDMEVVSTEHYVVCGPKGRARDYASLFEKTYRDCRGYFSVRGLKIEQSEFPLVGIVLPSVKQFSDYMQSEGSRYSPGLMGYYSPTSNRCVLYEHGATTAMNDDSRLIDLGDRAQNPFPIETTDYYFAGGANASVLDTIIHEGMHQVAFNIGVHSRWGENPRWVVEGLATVFEAPGVRERSGSIQARLNMERYVYYLDYIKNRRQDKSLEKFIGSDVKFQSATLDAYAQAWALTFYLLETRSSQFAKYLKRLSERDPLKSVSGKDRIADFQAEFGKDLDWLDVEMERYFTRLN